MSTISAILPMRAGSKRVPQKNTRPFGPYRSGLAELKLRQLLGVPELDEIVVDTDEPRIDEIVECLSSEGLATSAIRIERRDARFATDVASTDDLIRYLGGKLRTDHVLWTHVTSPFATGRCYSDAIARYRSLDFALHDSLMSVTPLKEFIWDSGGPKNYDYAKEKWPRTQALPDWYFINSAMFLCPSNFYTERGNRIGDHPFLFEMDKVISLDVDWPEDFEIAESLLHRRTDLAGL